MIRRRHTRPVRVGQVVIGGDAPIVVQSMTTTTPENLEGSLAQIIALRAAGCEIVRLAAASIEAARALGALREALRERGIEMPLCADVHFNPRAAYEAARHVEKVRINPGNFAPSPEEGRRRLAPLLDLLRERGAALRIGVNHGSLAPHISAAYGHGPRGMVMSALEYLRFCRDAGFEQLIVALKASNPAVMVAANRLLAEALRTEGMDYPIHLGVTEAGAEEEGVLRSALGIGALLLEGIGDTIRVSLTGDPVPEIEAGRRILRAVEAEGGLGSAVSPPEGWAARSAEIDWGGLPVGGFQPPRVEQALTLARDRDAWPPPNRAPTPFPAEVWVAQDEAVRRLLATPPVSPTPEVWLALPAEALAAVPADLVARVIGLHVQLDVSRPGALPCAVAYLEGLARRFPGLLLRWDLLLPGRAEGAPGPAGAREPVGAHTDAAAALARQLLDLTHAAGLPSPAYAVPGRGSAAVVRALATLQGDEQRPLLSAWVPSDPVRAAVALGPLLIDGLLDTLIVAGDDVRPAYDILQVARRRMLRADFISCPGCGRLAYDLEGALRRLKARCGHLAGVKIAVMGCAVNGPGEMADADVGYVGSAAGKVDVYAGRERVGRGLDPDQAEALLVELLRARGLWREPPQQRPH